MWSMRETCDSNNLTITVDLSEASHDNSIVDVWIAMYVIMSEKSV